MNDDIRELIRSRIPIEQLVGRDIKLTRCGSRFQGSSLKNPDKDPSLVVYPHNGSWFDFSSGTGGDHIDWLEYSRGATFREALLELGSIGGFDVPAADPAAIEQYRESVSVAQILTMAAKHYHQALPVDIRQEHYAQGYGFSDETVDRLLLGWADGGLWDHLMSQGISPDNAMSTGLFVRLGKDLWQNRLVFPFWRGGLVRYFSARQTHLTPDEPWENRKYRKLPTKSESRPHVSDAVKNDVFYGENEIMDEHVIITEGITDAISLMQAGFSVISPTTAKFRKDDIPRLIRMTEKVKRITICNDTDQPGIDGMLETALILHEAGRNVYCATLPAPEDALEDDDRRPAKNDVNQFMRCVDDPRGAFQQILDSAKHVIQYKLDQLPRRLPPTEIAPALRPVLELVSRADPVARDTYTKAIRSRFGIKAATMNGLLHKAEKNLEVKDGLKLATQVVEFVVETSELTHFNGVAYAAFGGWTLDMDSVEFKDHLIATARQISGQTPGQNPVRDACADLSARARAGKNEPVHLRVAEHDGDIFIDTMRDGLVIHISPGGWRITDSSPVKFVRSPNMLPMTMPVRSTEDPLDLIRQVFNAKSDRDALLLLGWILGTLRCRYPSPALILAGEQGTAKSTAARIARQIIDPSTAPLRSPPEDEQGMAVGCAHSYVQVYDNLSRIPGWMSDAICRVVTGGGLARRKLYTNSDEHVVNYMRPVILTGIDDLATRGDLAERSVHIELERISPSARVSEEQLQVKIERVLPLLLGRILDGAAAGLRNAGKVRLAGMPRMADFATWISACSEGLGLADGAIYDAYKLALGDADTIVVQSDPVSMALVKVLQEEFQGRWTGTMQMLAKCLASATDERITRDKLWPKDARGIGRWIRRIGKTIEEADVARITVKRTNSASDVTVQLLPGGEALDAGARRVEDGDAF